MSLKHFDQSIISLQNYRKPKSKKRVTKYYAICQVPNMKTVERVTGQHTSKNGFKKELHRRGYVVKGVFII